MMIGVLAGYRRGEPREKHDDQLDEETASRAPKFKVGYVPAFKKFLAGLR